MKYIKIIFIFLLLSGTPIFSQTVSFTAIDSTNGNSIQLDSVIVINHNTNYQVVLKENYKNKDLKLLTSIPFNSIFNSNNSREIICNDGSAQMEFLSILPYSKIIISITNLNGKKLLKRQIELYEPGYYKLLIPFNNLSTGIYFIMIQSANNIETKIVLNTSANSTHLTEPQINDISIEKEANYDVLVNTEYTFIGMSRGYFTDTINITNPSNGMVIQFKMGPKSKWAVRKCKFFIKSLSVENYYHIEKWGSGALERRWDHTDTFKFSTEYANTCLFLGRCDTNSRGNNILIRKFMGDAWPIRITFTAEIDSAKSILNDVVITYYQDIPIGNNVYIKEDFKMSFSSITCDSVSYNYISARAYLNDLKNLYITYAEEQRDNKIHFQRDEITLKSLLKDSSAYVSIILSQ